MGKKFLPLLILALTMAAGGLYSASPVSASILDPAGNKVWTLEEVTTAAAEIEEIFATECPDDILCQGRIYAEYSEASGLYKGTQVFHVTPFLLTSINPSTGTVKILFHTEKNTFGNFTPREDQITEVRMVWADEGSPDIINTYGGTIPIDLPDWAHLIYMAKRSTQGSDWIQSYTEFEISAPESNLELNTSGFVKYKFDSIYSNARGTIDYSNCLNSPYYEPGVECRIVFKDTNRVYDYVPYKDGRPAYPNSGYVEPTIEPEEEGLGGETDSVIDNPTAAEPAASINASPIQIPKAPETGAQTYPTEVCSREINLPWWTLALILAGNALLIWWFIPNHQKTPKNSKKS